MFIEDCRYYDSKNTEVKTILKYVELKGKTLLDIGAGIGRLSFPLSKYAKKVIALDKDKRFKEYFKRHKKGNITFINEDIEKFVKKGKRFDVILLAWPAFNFRFIPAIKKLMNKDSTFIFMTCSNSSDFETIIDKLEIFRKNYFNKSIKRKRQFIRNILKQFKLTLNKKILADYIYPDENTTFRVLKNDMKMFYNAKFNRKIEEKLKEIINKHKINKKIKFDEEVWFYLFKLKLKTIRGLQMKS